MLDWERRNI